MQTGLLPFDVALSTLLPSPFNKLMRPVEPALLRHFLPDCLCSGYTASDPLRATAERFASEMLRHLDISYKVEAGDLERIPKSGPCMVVANHPFGLLEGFILVTLLEKIRPDYRIVANTLLSSTPALHERVIFVNPFEEARGSGNSKSLRASIEFLRKGGLLVTFPAGEVSHFSWTDRNLSDPIWKTSAARLAMRMGCPTVPLFFNGTNSLPFHMLGTFHPCLRTLNLARELVNKRRRTIFVSIGTPVTSGVLKKYADARSATSYLRARTYLLHDRKPRVDAAIRLRDSKAHKGIAETASISASVGEVAALDSSRILASNDEFKVLIANANEIPRVLVEIGRAREKTYREIGEGTGKSLDLDEFDSYYRHLILWSNRDQRVAGAYRLVTTPDVLAKRGVRGLYTSTLFQYQEEFFRHLGPAIELGRSFICREYQKQYAPLLLLWKGIVQFARRHSECPVLFGVVSISGRYQHFKDLDG
jgi:putative hemolysin